MIEKSESSDQKKEQRLKIIEAKPRTNNVEQTFDLRRDKQLMLVAALIKLFIFNHFIVALNRLL